MAYRTAAKFGRMVLVMIFIQCVATRVFSDPDKAMNATENTTNLLQLDLERSFVAAISSSFDLKAIKAQETVHRLTIYERLRDYFPTLGLSYTQTEEQRQGDADSRSHRISTESKIVVFDGGARSLASDIARLQAVQSRNDYRIAMNAIITDVSAAYFDALNNRDAVAIHKNTLARSRMQLEFISKELALGDATKLDALAIEAQVREVELNLCRAEENYSRSLNRLKQLLRIDWRQPVGIIGDIDTDFRCYPLGAEFSPERLIAIGVKNRKEIASADIEFSIQRQKHLLSTRYYYPKLSLGLNYSLSGEDRIPHERGWGISMQVSSALFGNSASATTGYTSDRNGNSHAFSDSGSVAVLDSLSYRRTIAESEIAMKSSFDRKTKVRQQVAIEIDSALKSLDEAWKMISLAQERLNLYDSFLSIERLKADMGESRRYDLVKKEIERGEAALSRLSAITGYMLAAAAVETAVGLDIGSLNLVHMRKKENEN